LLDDVNRALRRGKALALANIKGLIACVHGAHTTRKAWVGVSSRWRYEITPILTAAAYASPWLCVRIQTRFTEIFEQNAL
jgi:hypothetical protein